MAVIPPLDVALQARVCRGLAADMRTEAALGYGPIRLRDRGNGGNQQWISRADAALNMDEQADRWEAELKTGIPNDVDRPRIGEPVNGFALELVRFNRTGGAGKQLEPTGLSDDRGEPGRDPGDV